MQFLDVSTMTALITSVSSSLHETWVIAVVYATTEKHLQKGNACRACIGYGAFKNLSKIIASAFKVFDKRSAHLNPTRLQTAVKCRHAEASWLSRSFQKGTCHSDVNWLIFFTQRV